MRFLEQATDPPPAVRRATLNPMHWLRRLLPTSRRLLLERALRRLDLKQHQSVLVVGAGHDPYRGLFADDAGYVRVDIEAVPGVTDVVADATCLPFADDQFQCVIATECMEHIADPFALIEELQRVACPGGQIVLTVPFLFHQHGDPEDYWRPTSYCLTEMLRQCQQADVYTLGNRLHVISDLLTTARPRSLLVPLRIINHLLVRLPGSLPESAGSSAPSGFLVSATV